MAQRFPRILATYMAGPPRLSGPVAGERFGVTHGTIQNWLAGTHVPPRGRARRIAEVMGRPDLVGIIDSDRVAHGTARQAAQARPVTKRARRSASGAA